MRDMFAGIAPQYDLLNSILSFNRHKAWRRRAVRLARVTEGSRCLDVCSGTGDFAIDLAAAAGRSGRVACVDFCEPMLRRGLPKTTAARGAPISMLVGNAEHLPYASGSFDVATVGFGIRNVADADRALREMARVVRSGGRVVILEFNRPAGRWMRAIVDLYLFGILPRIGGLLSRREAYSYLPESMKRFLSRQELSDAMERAGLRAIEVHDLNFGTVCIHIGARTEPTP